MLKKLHCFVFSICVHVSIVNGHQVMYTDQVNAFFLKKQIA
jgi:hypothetical protein